MFVAKLTRIVKVVEEVGNEGRGWIIGEEGG